MADSNFWRDLARDFRALPEQALLLRANWNREVGASTDQWIIQASQVVWGGHEARVSFEVLARRGGIEINHPRERSPLDAWLDAVKIEIPTNEFGTGIVNEVVVHAWGALYRISEGSATFCGILEGRALDVEDARRREQEELADPRNWSQLRQQFEAYEEIGALLRTPHKTIPESLVRSAIGRQHGIAPEEVTWEQIRFEVAALARDRGPIIVAPEINEDSVLADPQSPSSIASSDVDPSNQMWRNEEPKSKRVSSRLPGTVISAIAARRMETWIKNSPLDQTQFASLAGTTDRTLRSFRATGKIRRKIFNGIAQAMGVTPEDLLKPE